MSGFFGEARDLGHETLGGENAQPLDVKIVQAMGSPNSLDDVIVQCPEGYLVTGGGWKINSPKDQQPEPTVITNCPTEDGKGWVVNMYVVGYEYVVYAICVKVTP